MVREQGLETLQAQYADFRRRAEPGLTRGDILTNLERAIVGLERGGDAPIGGDLGDMLIDLCCLAEKESLDLAHHARQAFRAMQAEYEAGQ